MTERVAREPSVARAALVTYVIPAFNAQETIAEAIGSVLAQSSPHWKLIVVDDGSSDRTAEIVQQVVDCDDRVRLLTKENGGTGSAYNVGVRAASTPWTVMLSADDMVKPEHLETVHRAIEQNPGAGLITSNGVYLLDDASTVVVYDDQPWWGSGGMSLDDMATNCIMAVGAAFPREVWERIDGFEEDLYAEDYLFFLNVLALGYPHFYLPEILAVHRKHALQKSADAAKMKSQNREILRRLFRSKHINEVDARRVRAKLMRLKVATRATALLESVFGKSVGAKLMGALHRIWAATQRTPGDGRSQ